MALTEEQIQELQTYAGIDPEKFESVEDAKKEFDENFIPVKNAGEHPKVKAVYGKRVGEVETKIKSLAKSLDIDFEEGEWKDRDIDSNIETFEQKVNGRIKELQDTASKTDDKKAEKFQEQLDTFKKRYEEQKAATDKVSSEFEDYKKTYEERAASQKVNLEREKVFGELPFSDQVGEEARIGFNSIVSRKYDIKYEGDDFIITDKDGNRIQNPKKAGEFLTPKQVLMNELNERNLAKTNPNGGKKVEKPGTSPKKGVETVERRKIASTRRGMKRLG